MKTDEQIAKEIAPLLTEVIKICGTDMGIFMSIEADGEMQVVPMARTEKQLEKVNVICDRITTALDKEAIPLRTFH